MNIDLAEKLIQLYKEDPSTNLEKRNLSSLENHPSLRRRVDAFELYKKYLKGKTRFLDWGCKDALDSYLIRTTTSEEVEIFACDVQKGNQEIFGQKANIIYSELTHYYQLPYENNYFDAVIGSGVLEHVPNDFESLKELYRIIKPDGHLMITFLPNELSYTESLNQLFRNRGHNRRYSMQEIKKMLLHTGFVPVDWGYHQLTPTLATLSGFKQRRIIQPIANKIYDFNKYAEKIYPINKLAANIFVISQKQSMI
jgi:ubiquinone/menaquinone biosynthesis C-methylase UbiE